MIGTYDDTTPAKTRQSIVIWSFMAISITFTNTEIVLPKQLFISANNSAGPVVIEQLYILGGLGLLIAYGMIRTYMEHKRFLLGKELEIEESLFDPQSVCETYQKVRDQLKLVEQQSLSKLNIPYEELEKYFIELRQLGLEIEKFYETRNKAISSNSQPRKDESLYMNSVNHRRSIDQRISKLRDLMDFDNSYAPIGGTIDILTNARTEMGDILVKATEMVTSQRAKEVAQVRLNHVVLNYGPPMVVGFVGLLCCVGKFIHIYWLA